MDQPYKISAWLLQRALAIIYLIAFVSFGIQAKGLIGSGGLLPVGDFLKAAREAFGARNRKRATRVSARTIGR